MEATAERLRTIKNILINEFPDMVFLNDELTAIYFMVYGIIEENQLTPNGDQDG
jgi:hypothetical protein